MLDNIFIPLDPGSVLVVIVVAVEGILLRFEHGLVDESVVLINLLLENLGFFVFFLVDQPLLFTALFDVFSRKFV